MIIYKIRNLLNFNSSLNCQISKNCFFEIVKFWKFDDFRYRKIWEIFVIFEIGNFLTFQIEIFRNF